MEIEQPSRFITTNKLEQCGVVNEKGQELGQVQDFMIDTVAGRIAFAIVSFLSHGGQETQETMGIIGLSEKWFAVPWELLVWLPDKGKFLLDIKREVLEKAPGLNKDKWMEEIDLSWLSKNYLHYGRYPYWENSITGKK